LVDAEHKLQTLNGAGLSVLTGLSVPFFFDSSLSVEWFRLKSGASSSWMLLEKKREMIRVKDLRVKTLNDEPSFLLVEFVAHTLAKLLEFTFRLCIVGVDHEILEMFR